MTLVAGGDSLARETVIAARLAASSGVNAAVIIEGIAEHAAHFGAHVHLVRIAPGCPCCTGRLTMQVMLNRILRTAPNHVYIAMSDATHICGMRDFLAQAPYDTLVKLDDNLLL